MGHISWVNVPDYRKSLTSPTRFKDSFTNECNSFLPTNVQRLFAREFVAFLIYISTCNTFKFFNVMSLLNMWGIFGLIVDYTNTGKKVEYLVTDNSLHPRRFIVSISNVYLLSLESLQC